MHPIINPRGNSKGFTLLEAMIGLFVISIGLLAITRMQITSINGNASAMGTMQATAETNSQAELLQSMNFDDLTAGDHEPQTSPDGRITTTMTVTDVPLFDNNTYKSIDLVTTWIDKSGNHVSMHSTITKTPN